MGSPDIYFQPEHGPNRSINFITCHDGFTLNDLVSYNKKHNLGNGEENRDGADHNFSWNCGEEGPTTNLKIETLRLRQIKNFFTILFMSQGTPMLLMGDEVKRTQLGNNNAYCQDNKLSWFDWSLVEENASLLEFVRNLIAFIQTKQLFQIENFLATSPGKEPYVIWHGTNLEEPGWEDNDRTLAFTLHHPEADEQLYVMLNSYWKPLPFKLPPLLTPEKQWYRIVDTALPPPEDFCAPEKAPHLYGNKYKVEARSSVIFMAQSRKGG
jgi:glycogen operon protein